jgi:hypothetical protein
MNKLIEYHNQSSTEPIPDDEHEELSITDIFALIKRHYKRMILTTFACGVVAIGVGLLLPEQYKSYAILDIQGTYFRHPLVSNLVSEVNDPRELNSMRASLLQYALNDRFLHDFGERFNLYRYPPESPRRLEEREALRDRIEYFSVSPTSFSIATIADNATLAFEMTNRVLSQITHTLIERRYLLLQSARDAIQRQAGVLNRTLLELDGSSMARRQRQVLEEELIKMDTNLKELRSIYTENHPQIQQLESRNRTLQSQFQELGLSMQTDKELKDVFSSHTSLGSSQEIYDNLLKMLSDLNIVLEMERDRGNVSYLGVIQDPNVPLAPISPKKPLLLLLGLGAGAFLSLVQVGYLELQRVRFVSPEQAARALGVSQLGELPVLIEEGKTLLIEAPKRSTQALPFKGA